MEWKKRNKKDIINKLLFIKQFSKIKHDQLQGVKNHMRVYTNWVVAMLI